ncbi:MAG: hypothetical protein GXP46_01770 [Deferribacteres bacterium]|nr:hypothetical protein [Deferribacteres bacterium]
MDMPILRFELEGLKRSFMAVLNDYNKELEQMVQKAMNEYCTPENLESIINAKAASIIRMIIEEEMERFCLDSEEIREAIRNAVIAQPSSFNQKETNQD